jgi:D-alanine-D-alanine ligase
VVLPHAAFRELGAGAVLDRLVGHLGLPLMVKPPAAARPSARAVVDKPPSCPARWCSASPTARPALVEQFVTGTEIAVSVVEDADGPRALPAVEVSPLSGVYDYTARYTAGHTEYYAPARLPEKAAAAAEQAALAAHAALGLRDLSRVDLVVDAEGRSTCSRSTSPRA